MFTTCQGQLHLTHSLIHHFETIPNSKKLQTATEAIIGFQGTDCKENIVEKVKLLMLSNFTILNNVFLKLFSSMC